MDFITKGLQALAGLLDTAIPGKGARTITVVVLTLLAHVALFLSGQETAQQASTSIAGLVAVVFAALHQNPPTA